MSAYTGFRQEVEAVLDEIEQVIIGKREVVRLALLCLLADGHALIEDIPGVGKTTLAKALARCLGGEFKRIQFTPDLLPGDITGVSIYNQKTGEFVFTPGPVFANVVLADEVNRTTPKTQSSLLECMEERQVTVDGVSHPVPQPFFVIATENPLEYRGTYPLPEAQLDRFLLRLRLGYPTPDQEVEVLESQVLQHPLHRIKQVLTLADVVSLQKQVREVAISADLKRYVIALVDATRRHERIALGASPRGSLGLMRCAQALAAATGRDHVRPDDVKAVLIPVLAHRVILRPEIRSTDATQESVMAEIAESVPVPVEV